MEIGDRVLISVSGDVDEILGDWIIIHNEGGYFGTSKDNIVDEDKYVTRNTANAGISQARKEGYKIGCEDAWRFAAQLDYTSAGEIRAIFGHEVESIASEFSYEEAIAMYREYMESEWRDIPADDMTLEQARRAVKELRQKIAEG